MNQTDNLDGIFLDLMIEEINEVTIHLVYKKTAACLIFYDSKKREPTVTIFGILIVPASKRMRYFPSHLVLTERICNSRR